MFTPPDEDEPSAEELAEAGALAALLDGKARASGVSEEIREVTALLRVAKNPELDVASGRRIGAELLDTVKLRTSAEPQRRGWLAWLGLLIPGVAALTLWLVASPAQEEDGAVAARSYQRGTHAAASDAQPIELREGAVPRPPAALLQAQAEALSNPAGDRTRLRDLMQAHRYAVLATLEVP